MNPFSLCIGLGAALGLFSLARRADKPDLALNAGLILEACALIGARAGYVLAHPEYFTAHPGEMAAFWLGGLSWAGCAAGMLIGTVIVSLIFKLPLAAALGLAFTLSMPLAVLTWLGAWSAGLGYGQAAASPSLLAWPTLDESGRLLPRIPLQIACAAFLLLLSTLIEAIPTSWKRLKAKSSALTGLLLAADLFAFSLLRADPLREIAWPRGDLLAVGVLMLISLAAFCLPDPNSGKTGRGVS